MATYSVQSIVPGGAVPTYGAVASTDKFPDDGKQRTFLHVKNGSGASVNVTISKGALSSRVVPGIGSVAIADKVVAVAAGADEMIGPFTDAYRDATGNVNVAYSATTTVTAAAIQLQRADA
jgi:hypothetical protein